MILPVIANTKNNETKFIWHGKCKLKLQDSIGNSMIICVLK